MTTRISAYLFPLVLISTLGQADSNLSNGVTLVVDTRQVESTAKGGSNQASIGVASLNKVSASSHLELRLRQTFVLVVH